MKNILAFTLLLLSVSGRAQNYLSTLSQMEPETTPPQLFQLNPEQYNHHFEFILPDNGKLLVDFLRLSDWGMKNQLQEITDIAAQQAQLLRDSFQSNYSNKLIALNVPVNGQIISINYKEDLAGKRQLAYRDGTLYQLKSGADTVRIVKNIGIRSKPLIDSGLIQVQYTFVLKDLNDIAELAANHALLERLGAAADEEIGKRRRRWSRQDADFHTLILQYNPEAPHPLTVEDQGGFLSFMYTHIGLYVGVGMATYTNNGISPYLDESIAYIIPSRGRMRPFVGLNVTAFGYLSSNGSKATYTSYNVEFGLCKRSPGFLQQKTSIAIGMMQPYGLDNNGRLFHLGFTFGFNSFLSGGFFFANDFKKDSKRSLLGVNFKFNL